MTREVLQMVHDALINSSDALWNEYQSDWRHGVPTRKAQLDGKLRMAEDHDKAITAIKAALAQQDAESHLQAVSDFGQLQEQEQEPVAWMYEVNGAHTILDLCEPPDDAYDEGTLCPLYTSPPKRQPLSMEQLGLLSTDPRWAHIDTPVLAEFARAIEQAHGIGDKT